MWKIAKQSFGFVLTFAGPMDASQLRAWVDESRRQLGESLPAEWGVVVDMRELPPLDAACQALMQEGQEAYRKRGMKRSAVALKDSVTTLQFRRLARASGIDQWERYINTQQQEAWQSVAKRWIVDGLEPPV